MTYFEVMKYCLGLPGVERRSTGSAGNAFVFVAGENVFAYFETGAPVQWRLTLRVTEEHYEGLYFPPKVIYAEDKPGGDWLTIVRVESFDETLLKELIDWSYNNAAKSAECEGES